MKGGTLGKIRWVLFVAIIAVCAGIAAGDDAVAEFESVGVSPPEPEPESEAEWEWAEGEPWARDTGEPRQVAPELLAQAYRLEQKGKFPEAAREYYRFARAFPAPEKAGVALQRLAKCVYEMGEYYTAFQIVDHVIDNYSDTNTLADLLEIEFRIGKRILRSATAESQSDRSIAGRDAAIRQALEILDAVIDRIPYGPLAAEACLAKGEGSLLIDDIEQAAEAFEIVRDEFPESEYADRARFGLLYCERLAGWLGRDKSAGREERPAREAAWTSASFAGPEWEWAKGKAWTLNPGDPETTAKGQFIAAFRFDVENRSFDAARQYYLLLRAYPHSGEAELALQRLAKCLYDMGDYPASLHAIRQAMVDYPDSGGSETSAEITMLIAARILADATRSAASDSCDNSRGTDIKQALEAIDTALELDPRGPYAAEGFFTKGVGGLRLGETDSARTAFETVCVEFPGSDLAEAAQLGLLRCDALAGKYARGDAAERERGEAAAAKLLDAAEQYRRENSDTATRAARYLYSEAIRCWPATSQAAEAWEKLTEFAVFPKAERAVPSISGAATPPEEDMPWPMPDITEVMNALAEPAEVPGVPESPDATPLLDATAGIGKDE